MFYIDRQGGIWTSTRNSIIRLTEKHPAGFQTYLKDENLDRSIRGMIQIGNQLYVSSYKGDCRINTKNGSVSAFNILYGQGLCFLADGKGCWAGGHGGKLIYLEPGRPNTHYTFERRADIYTFLQSDDGILIGSSNGLFRINQQQHTVTPLPFQNISIDYLYRNHKGIWACTADGLYLINEHGYVVTHYLARTADLNYNRLTCLYEDEKGDFWISTRGGGLIHWSADRGIIRQFTESDGLSSNDIHAVYADTRGFLWLPGNYGLMRLHRESGRIQVFFKRDGIADNEFNALSHYQAPDGRLYFGGVNGITAFYPDDIPIQETRTPQLRLIEARTFQIKSGEFVNHLPDVYGGGPIVVTPGDDYLDIRISPLVYEDINRIKYSWKLDGYSDQWIQQQEPLIRLHNLPYGKHQLHIRYSLQGNIWSENELIIPVFVERPFYLSWPFLTTMTLCILGIAWGAGNWRATQLRKANLQLEQEVKSRTRQIEADKQVIEQQARELRSLDEVKSRFFANVTHELRTPLTLIIGPADSILRANITPEKKMEYIQTIRRNATRLLNLVEELLDLSRMEANSISVVEKPTRLYQFLARLTAAFAPYAEHRGIGLNLQFKCPVSTTLMMDVPKWEKIINNLLNNAIKFTPGGGAVIITAEIKDEKMIISVEDTGSGIHPDDMPFIFDRYYQSRMENASLQGGAGIGLSLCHEYMKLFGGEISVQSEPGKGSRFTLSRPLALSSAVETVEFPDQHDEIATIPSATRSSHQPGKYTLLLVEDDRDMSEYIQHIIESEYNLLTADNGKSALQILENNQVDLVLSDVMMPQMDGFQLLEAVRERFGDLPFIMLTARSEPPDRLQALRMGVDDYITKPFLQEELSTRIANLLKYLRIRKNARIGPDIPDNETGYDQKWLAQLEQIVVEHIHNTDFSVEMMADLLHISRRSLFYKLRSCTGMTPNQYLTEVRLNRARYLIETGAFQTISEVCYAVGFKTPHYFSKLMKERFGERL
jgi:signal transduction histidine kinase/CheY-like chemotaxis protein/AraC-like DNA-binding protein/sugar lactone lactonase YvrE